MAHQENAQQGRPATARPDEPTVRVSHAVIAAEAAEVFRAIRFRFDPLDCIDGRYTPEFVEKLQRMPKFTLPAMPHEVSAELEVLPRDTEVLLCDGGDDFEVQKAEVALWVLRERMERQAQGRLTVEEAVRALAEATGGAKYVFREAMFSAYRASDLKLYRRREGTEVDVPKDCDPDIEFLSWGLDCCLTAKGLNAWLEQCSITAYRFSEPTSPEKAQEPSLERRHGGGRRATDLDPRKEATYLRIIGGMLGLMLGKTPAGNPQSVFKSQTSIIDALEIHYANVRGISKTKVE